MERSVLLCIFMVLSINHTLYGQPEKYRLKYKSEELIEQIRNKYRDVYTTYDGIRLRQYTHVEEIDIKSGKIIELREITMLREEYFYKKPVVRVEKYVVNGETKPNDNCKVVLKEPVFPVFDHEGEKNYVLENCGITVFEGDTLVKIIVTPVKNTSLHFKGDIYFTVDSLKMKYIIGTLGKISLPLKSIHMKQQIDLFENVPVTIQNETEIKMHVPLLYPEKLFISKTRATDIELIKK